MHARWLVGLFLLLLPLPAMAVAVTGGLRVVPTSEGLTVRLALSEPLSAPPRAFALADPMRWAIDLDDASSLRRDVEGGGPAKAARVSQFDPRTVRLVIDLDKPMQLVSAYQDRNQVLELRFRPVDGAGFRREVARGRKPVAAFAQEAPRAVPPGPEPATDLAADSAARMDAVETALAAADQALTPPAAGPGPVAPQITRPVPPVDLRAQPPPAASVAPPAKLAPPRQTPVASARPSRRKHYLVVLDPGHGGTDPGAPSAVGGHEKEVTLAIAKAAKSAIEKRARAKGVPIEVRLTRDTDFFVTLGGRVRQARQWGADLFISIHADSAPNVGARGASVYTLSEVASDREAARVAAKENRADMIAGVDISGENREVASILVDLGMRDAMNASSDFAESLQNGLEPEGVLFRTQFHRFANFQVLRNLGVPAVLLETGFLSNTDDAAYLFSKKGQAAIGEGVGQSVVSYLGKR